MRGLTKLTIIELKMFYREPAAFFFTLIMPVMLLGIFGSIYGNEPSSFFNGLGYVDTAVPAFSSMIIASSGLISITIIFSTYREQGVLRRLHSTPILPQTILTALVIVIYALTALGMVLLFITGKIVYDLKFMGNIFNVLFAFTLCCFSFFSIGFVLSGVIKTSRTAQGVSNVIFFPMMFLSGAAIPLEVIERSVGNFNQFLPLTHVVTFLRGVWSGNGLGDHLTEIGVLSGILLLGILVSVKTFRWE